MRETVAMNYFLGLLMLLALAASLKAQTQELEGEMTDLTEMLEEQNSDLGPYPVNIEM